MKIANYTACSGPETFAEYVRAATGDFLLVSENSAAISKVVQRGLRVCVMLAGFGKRRNSFRQGTAMIWARKSDLERMTAGLTFDLCEHRFTCINICELRRTELDISWNGMFIEPQRLRLGQVADVGVITMHFGALESNSYLGMATAGQPENRTEDPCFSHPNNVA